MTESRINLLWLKALGVCLILYVPPALMIDIFGFHWYTGVLLFWGGMGFMKYTSSIITREERRLAGKP